MPGEESRRKMTETLYPDKSRESPPAFTRWAEKLSNLLEDGDGAELFKRFVELEGEEHSNRLKFYFACEGLKQQSDPERVTQLIGAIYRKFLKRAPRDSKLYVDDQMRNMIKAGLKNEPKLVLTPDIFDQMQADVAMIIGRTTYPNFLQSDLYLQYIQNMQSSSGSGSTGASCASGPLGLPSSAVGASSSSAGALSSMTSSSSTSELISHSSSALPTLHEDSELANADSIEQLYGATGPAIAGSSISVTSGVSGSGSSSSSNQAASNKPAMTLTRDALMATQRRRLEMRPPGPHGYSVYTNYASYNPVSRRDSELASLSSGRTDSDTMSLSSISTDGRPHSQRRQHNRHHSSIERRLMNENASTNKEPDLFAIIPRTHRHAELSKPIPKEEFVSQLMSKLEMLKQEQEKGELVHKKLLEVEQSEKSQSNKLLADAIRQKFPVDDNDNDQDILDQHVSRVFSDLTPNRSPGTMSPCPNLSRIRRHDVVGFGTGSISAQSSMRHSKSMPEGHTLNMMGPPPPPSRKLNNKWPSINTDSGISLFSTDTLTKYSNKDVQSMSTSSSRPLSRTMHADISAMNTATLLQESSRRLEDETRRSKRYQHPLPPNLMQNIPLQPPPLPPPAASIPLVPPPIPAKPSSSTTEFTVVVYSFCDEEVPYRIKIPGTNPPTLKQFKDYLPKKGNYRFFFKTRCDDPENPIIQEEINNDTETLPLFEGKVMGTVKPAD